MYHSVNHSCIANGSTCSQATKPDAGGQGVVKGGPVIAHSDSKTSETQVSITYESRSSSLTWGSSTASYQHIQEVNTAEPVITAKNSYSSAILGAIEAQLMRDTTDGATAEELESRLQAGWDGFQKGYGEALQQLEVLADFTPEVKVQIEETFNQVAQGLAELAERLGVNSPVEQQALKPQAANTGDFVTQAAEAAPPTAESRQSVRAKLSQHVMSSVMRDYALIEQLSNQRTQQSDRSEASTYSSSGSANLQRYSYAVSESRSFDFGLTTQDGDEITLKISADKLGFAQLSDAMSSPDKLLQFGAQSSNFHFSVEGELDSDELEAIHRLLEQVGEISNAFFNGDMTNAIELAKAIEFDANEINLFDVHLGKSTTEIATVERAFNNQQPSQDEPQNSKLLGDFVNKIDVATQLVESLGKPKSLVAELADWVAQNIHPRDPMSSHVGTIVKGYL